MLTDTVINEGLLHYGIVTFLRQWLGLTSTTVMRVAFCACISEEQVVVH